MISRIKQIASQLEAVYPADEAKALAWWIAEETTGLTRSQILTGCKITKNFAHTQEIVERLLHFEPIQYIFGHTEWCGLDMKVTPATLIPRPETAELVEIISHCEFQISNCRVLDIGTGSGCIALALKKRHPDWQVTGIDISEEAIEVARENARRNGVEVTFLKKDVFSDRIGTFDIVVSNPPYIRECEKQDMRPNVLDFEPGTALFVPDDDPLLFYRRIATICANDQRLKYLFFEINEAFGQETADMLQREGYTYIQIHQDSYGKSRFISCRMAG